MQLIGTKNTVTTLVAARIAFLRDHSHLVSLTKAVHEEEIKSELLDDILE